MQPCTLSPMWRKFLFFLFAAIVLGTTVYDDLAAQVALEEVYP